MNPPEQPPDTSEQTLFETARLMPDPKARAAYLDAACAGNAALRERVERLLRAGQRAEEFLASDPLELGESGRQTLIEARPTESPGTLIGNYKPLEKLGEGGFGVVYMAEQKQPVKRRVALKIIKVGMDTREVVARFEAERQALALMDHPNIAKIFDAGITEHPLTRPSATLSSSGGEGRGEGDAGAPRQVHGEEPGEGSKSQIAAGRPYFVMELVRGTRITDYCDEKNLFTRQRLDLFTQVCQAVQHAHQKGIIHRDLKPSNILVTVNDGVAVPKIIDFGIAKATQMELTEKTLFTRFHQFLGTPAYMSPEQAELTSVDIDTRSDIYPLGVLLYELLTGKTPFDANELLKAGLDEMRRTIREVEPPKPSTRLTQELVAADVRRLKSKSETRDPNTEEKIRASSRRLLQEKERLITALRGDLDWIVMKCLEKDRARRYETANGLAADIQRHLNSEPVVACPPSKLYRFQKLVRRNKLAFAAGASVAAALVLGFCVATWGLLLEREARKRAVAAEQVQDRLRQRAQANEQTARTEAAKLRQVAQFFEDMLAGAGPEVAKGRDATILKEILNQTAQRIGTELTNQPVVEAYLRERIGNVDQALGDYPAAEQMQRHALALRRQLNPDGHRDVAKALSDLAMTVMAQSRLREAESLARESLDMGAKSPGLRPGDRAAWLNNLATILRREGKFAEAEPLYREALVLNRKLLGNDHREVAVTLNNLALVLAQQDKLDEAVAALREAIGMGRKLFGNEHPIVAQGLTSLTDFLKRQDKLQEAETVGREAMALQKKLLGAEHPNVALALGNLALVLEREGKLAEAESLHRDALAIRRKALGSEHPAVALSLFNLGLMLKERGDWPGAEALLRESLAITRSFPDNEYVDIAKVLGHLAEVLADQRKFDEAKAFFDEGMSLRKDIK